MPKKGLTWRVVHRQAGLGSLGRERFTAIVDWQGGLIAREAKALAPSAQVWVEGRNEAPIEYGLILKKAVRCPDPFLRQQGRWIVRRLAPDCSRIELTELPDADTQIRVLTAMGAETANIHLGSATAKKLLTDLDHRPDWLGPAAEAMAAATLRDWKAWCDG